MLLTPSPLLLSLLLLLLSSTTTFSGDPTTTIYSTCSKSQYPPNSPYQSNLNSLLSSLSAASSFTLYSQFSTSSPSISGLFQCHGDLSIPRCSACLRSAISLLPSLCPSSSSSSIQLHGCYLRYGSDSFIGLADTKLEYKTCSTSGNGGGDEFLADKNEAFAAAAVAPLTGSSYRVAAAGSVRLEAQCMGDLSLRDCDDCVLAAEKQAEVSCGGAAAGEIYLGKCYVWYSGRGEIPEGGGGGGGGGPGGRRNKPGARRNKDDEVGKTVAIMIGIIAVIVFIAICLYYVKRKAKGKE
ncbi:cysteine-rich repeat secretory protein 12-like [Phalaenopsis equestris]|uniref:cysteine-rich repeat secretory protein 12-like n=1 Tax=Phalaenopsis equestris TaxID=78828 RepID=UPI0009E1E619|nr:cysteine-rich repeat secretory protein 12-like [Phalaenopsis equestris]